jgi:hypothetical protein
MYLVPNGGEKRETAKFYTDDLRPNCGSPVLKATFNELDGPPTKPKPEWRSERKKPAFLWGKN